MPNHIELPNGEYTSDFTEALTIGIWRSRARRGYAFVGMDTTGGRICGQYCDAATIERMAREFSDVAHDLRREANDAE